MDVEGHSAVAIDVLDARKLVTSGERTLGRKVLGFGHGDARAKVAAICGDLAHPELIRRRTAEKLEIARTLRRLP